MTAHGEHVVLMNTRANLAVPHRPSTELVGIAAFVHQDIASLEGVGFEFALGHLDHVHVLQVDIPVLHVGYAQVGER